MFGDKNDIKGDKIKSSIDNIEPIKFDPIKLRANAGIRLNPQRQSKQVAIVNLNEGARVGVELFTLDKKKK